MTAGFTLNVSQRPGPDGQRRGAAFLVELELQPNLIEHA